MGQFKALCQKNWILWKRGWCGNITEVVIPIIFILFLIVIRKLITVTDYTPQSFLTNPAYTLDIYGQQSTASAASGSAYLKNCSTGTVVGLIPSGDPFVNTLNTKLSALGYTTVLMASDD
jgi:hypothetical protein